MGAEPAGTYPTLVRRLQERFANDLDVDAVRPVLFLDDSHGMRPEVLSILRILTNFEMDSRLVLSFVLAGQPPLSPSAARRAPGGCDPPPGPLRHPATALAQGDR